MSNLVILKCGTKAKFEKMTPFLSVFLTCFLKTIQGSFEDLEFNSS